MATLQEIGQAISEAMSAFGATTANAAAQSNAVSRQAQSAQAAFNSEAMNQANAITDNRLLSQYGYNSAMMNAANEYNTNAWQQSADWNEYMWEKQAKFNAEQAEIQRQWQEKMSNTQYQRAVNDMSNAGLNPILAVTGGGVGTSVPGGATASVGGASMGSAQSAQASGGIVGAESASINNYTGQMEQLTGMLGLLTAFTAAATSGEKALNLILDTGEETLGSLIGEENAKEFIKETDDLPNKSLTDQANWALENRPGSLVKDMLYNMFGLDKYGQKKTKGTSKQDEAQLLRYEAWNNSTYKYTKPKG